VRGRSLLQSARRHLHAGLRLLHGTRLLRGHPPNACLRHRHFNDVARPVTDDDEQHASHHDDDRHHHATEQHDVVESAGHHDIDDCDQHVHDASDVHRKSDDHYDLDPNDDDATAAARLLRLRLGLLERTAGHRRALRANRDRLGLPRRGGGHIHRR
jgi:hypothetical protein